MRYFIFRIDRDSKFILEEIKKGRLRQGWGANTMSLINPKNEIVSPEEWSDNYFWKGGELATIKRKYNNLKTMLNMAKGDFVIIPKYPDWGTFTIAKIKSHYKFEMPLDKTINDYGHLLEIEEMREFKYSKNNSTQSIASKFRAYQSPLNNVHNLEIIENCSILLNSNINENNITVEEENLIKIKTKKDENKFSIEASTSTLEKIIHKINGEEKQKIQFRVPIYQRPYSWGEKEIKRFIDDIFESFCEIEDNQITIKNKPMFIGTMQLGEIDNNNKQDIIDGQQRITTLNLLLLYLDRNKTCRFFETGVGGQEKLISEVFLAEEKDKDKKNSNIYWKNYHIIINEINKRELYLDEHIKKELINYIKTKLFFVTIETKASITETLKIFDTINTSGLDLSGADVFKIKMFEYLHKKENKDETIFNEIDRLYELVQIKNKELGTSITMTSILSLYKDYLIGKYEIPYSFLKIGNDTFFEKLFDYLIRNKNNTDFISNEILKKIESEKLELQTLENLINARFKWEEKKEKLSLEANLEENFIKWSRYSRYLHLIYLIIAKKDNITEKELEKIVSHITKLFIVYSVNYSKQINGMSDFIRKQYNLVLTDESIENILKNIKEKIDEDEEKKNFMNRLESPIANSTTSKNLLCRLVAMNYEKIDVINNKQEIIQKLFHEKIDIEHIESYNNEELEKRNEIWEEWGSEINCIGNLIILESSINRKIGNKKDEKIPNYKESKYKIVQDFVNNSNCAHETGSLKWTKECAEERKKTQVAQIIEYIYEKN